MVATAADLLERIEAFSFDEKSPKSPTDAFLAKSSFLKVSIQKTGQEDKLGIDVKHIDGKLEVVNIFPEGAIARCNKVNQTQNPPGETLQLGDVIHRVNDVDSGDKQMVSECRWKNELNLLVYRTGRAQVDGMLPLPTDGAAPKVPDHA